MKSISCLAVILCLIAPFPATATQTACSGSGGAVFRQFEKEGVTVCVPKQESDISVRVVQLPLPPWKVPTPTPGLGIHRLDRLVINFEIRDAGTGRLVPTLNPPFELRVNYTSQDYGAAHGKPVLAFWHEKLERWIAFNQPPQQCGCTGYHLVPQQRGTGFATVRVFQWGDRNIGWGE